MTELNLAFTPLLSWPLLAGLGAVAAGLALLLLAMAGPALEREEKSSLKEVVAIAVDRSGSQTIAERPVQTGKALAGLEERLKALGNVDVRVIESGAEGDDDGTRLFAALNAGLADVPLDRLGGVFLITDGLVDDVPAGPAALGFKAPLHALITGHEGERDRRIELLEAPRFGIVGKEQTI